MGERGSSRCAEFFHKAKPFLLMVGLQCGFSGMYILSEVTLKQGMSRYVLIVYRNSIAAIFLAPFAFFLERKIRPKMTISVFLQIIALAVLEPLLDQNLGYLGIKLTSSSYVSAIMNAVPAVTFIIAVILRLEKVKIGEVRSQTKVIGTIVTLAGALVMTLYKGPIVDLIWSPKSSPFGHKARSSDDSSDKNWLTGTICTLIACATWSSFYILQSITLKKYPAELSLAFWICLMGAIMSSVVTLVVERNMSVWSIGFDARLVAPLYTGLVCSGIAYYIQGVVMKTRDPVFVTAFNPLCMIIVAVLSSIILAQKLHLGSIIGAIIIAVGLYAVVWGKSKDNHSLVPEQRISDLKDISSQTLPITRNTNVKFDGNSEYPIKMATSNK